MLHSPAHRRRRVRACLALREAIPGADDAYARAVEASVQQHSGGGESYGATIFALAHALRERPELASKWSPEVLVTLPPQHLETEDTSAIWEGLEAEERAKREGYTRIKVKAGLSRCRKCLRQGRPGTDVVALQRQTRSADEPATIFYQCQDAVCMNRWRG